MSFFNEYPYRNITDLNLDWLIKAIRTLRHDVDDFVTMNSIKYADPIDWDITKQYEKNTVVIDANTGIAYLSVAEVPAGVNITRPEYWTVIFDLSRFLAAGVSNLANSYEAKLTYTATVPTTKGKWVLWNGTLYEAMNDINIGDRYVVGNNIVKRSVETFVSRVIAAINAEVQARQDADTTLQQNINAEAQARQDADGTLQNHIDAEAQARQDADGTLQNHIDAEAQARQAADGTLQDADEQLQRNIDAEAQARQNADNTINQSIANLNSRFTLNMKNRHFLFVGDSYGDETTEWAQGVIDALKLGDRGHNLCVGGAGFLSSGEAQYLFITQLQNYQGNRNEITDIIVCAGLNDSFSDVPYSQQYISVQSKMSEFNDYVLSNYPNAHVSIGYIGNGNDVDSASAIGDRKYMQRQCCKYVYYVKAGQLNWSILHNVEYLLTGSPANIVADGVHPSSFGTKELVSGIAQAILTGSADFNYPWYDMTLTQEIGSINGDCKFMIHNSEARIRLTSFYISTNAGVTINAGGTFKIATIGAMKFNKDVRVPCILRIYNYTKNGALIAQDYVKATLIMLGNSMKLEVDSTTNGAFDVFTSNQQSTITIQDLDFTFDSALLV